MGATASPPLVELRQVSKRFVKHLDLAAKIGRSLGARVHEEIVRAVDQVDIEIAAIRGCACPISWARRRSRTA